MKKNYTLFLVIFAISFANSQNNVGIGTNTPDASAKLDIIDANKGLLIPRVALTATNLAGPITSPATSLLVYNTATASSAATFVSPGYYYWDGAKWVRLLNSKTINANNGLSIIGDTLIQLGGTLIQATTITQGNNTFTVANNGTANTIINLSSTGDFDIQDNGTSALFVQDDGNVGVNANVPNVKLDVFGGFATRPNATTTAVTADNTSITVGNYSYIKVTSDNPDPTSRTITLTNGLQDGQYLVLYNASASNPVELVDGANLKMGRSPSNLYGNVGTVLIWNGTKWIEIRQVQQLPVKQVYTYTGSLQVFTVPSGVTKINVKMWGAGGGPGFYSSSFYACGGSGGYVAGDIVVTPGENLLIKVGAGGSSTGTGRTQDGYSWNFGGGAAGGSTSPTDGDVGIGGGASSIARGATILAVAGGGGGGAGDPSGVATRCYGGAGGSATAGNGNPGTSNANGYGRGGTVSAGGAGGTGGSTAGAAGTLLQGGRGGNSTGGYEAGGGGGGGYYGGGGGAGAAWSVNINGGGGGGSSYTGGLSGTITNTIGNTNITAGTYASPPNSSDVDYLPGVGRTGYVTTSGGNIIYDGGPGLIVITW